jgi:hypothetical protein
MKKLLYQTLLSLSAFLTVSCAATKVEQIGELSMISRRNIDTKMEYVLVKSYAGGGKEFKKSRAINIQEAIDQTVRNVPGGEFMKNVKIYLVGEKGDKKYFAVEGDVWGQGEASYKGFRVGDKVQWKTLTGTRVGFIRGFIDDQKCMVQEEGKTVATEEQYDKLRKLE